MVQHVAAAPPAAGRRARGGQAAVADGDLSVWPFRRVFWCAGHVLHADLPPCRWRGPGDGDIAAQADQDATADPGRDTAGGTVRGPGLGGGAQVEPDARGHDQRPALQADLTPAGHFPGRELDARSFRLDVREVAVVAHRGHGRADRRVDVAAGQPGRAQGHRDGLGQQRAYLGGTAAAAQGAELGVGTEPAARRVHLGKVGGEELTGLVEAGRFGHQEMDERAQGAPAGPGRGGWGGWFGGHSWQGDSWHYEPPEVTWPLPEFEDGEEPKLKPPELFELELDPVELEPEDVDPEPEDGEPELVEPEDVEPVEPEPAEPVEPEPVEPEEPEDVEPVEVEALACVDPGRTSANAPAAATLATAIAV